MPSLNKVVLIGHVGRDPEMRYTQGGDPIASFSLATSEKWTDKAGQKQERTEWHNISVFGKTATFVQSYVTKGTLLYVEGSLQTDEWTDKDGHKRKATKVNVSQFNGRVLSLSKSDKPTTPRGDVAPGISDDDVPF